MYKKEYFSDPLLLAVIFNDFETVRTLMDSENYNPTVFTNIFNNINYYGIPIPIHYISQCWDICLGHEFWEPFNQITHKCYGNAGKILSLFIERKKIEITEIPFSKIYSACWDDESEPEDFILDGKRSDYLSIGRREVDLDLFIAVNTMNFKKAKSLLEKGADPNYKHYGDADSSLIELCGGECSYQATCQAGDLLKSPGLFINSIDIDEIGSIFRWAANELMYDLLNSYIPKETTQIW